MKKLLTIFILMFCLFLVGCMSDSFDNYLKEINLPTEVSEDFKLPGTVNDKGNHDMYWTSSSKDVIKVGSYFEEDGLYYYYAYVTRGSVDKEVTLTLKLEVRDLGTMEKDYVIKVKKLETSSDEDVTLTFYAINDFHGSVVNDYGGMSVIGSYLMNQQENNPDSTIILSSGDMFQGTALSNLTKGKVVVECMNKIGFVSMTVGNHEFDWGVDVIKAYHDKTSEVKPDFPILAANIIEKETGEAVSWADPYTIIERSGLKIGIIGVIGSAIETSIAPKIVSPYEFTDAVPCIKKYAKILRTEKNCDIVIASVHDNTLGLNQSIADLSGEYQVDAIFNGHTHSSYAGETMGNDGYVLPYVQSGNVGKYIGKIELTYSKKEKKLIEGSAENITVSKTLASESKEINKIVSKYNDEVAPIIEEVIGVSGEEIDRYNCAYWIADVLNKRAESQIAFINIGGIRSNAFPIYSNQNITVGKIWEIYPFDNEVKTCVMKVKDIITMYETSGIIHSSNVSVKNNNLYVDGKLIDSSEKIHVSTIDYLFDNTSYPFLTSEDPKLIGNVLRDYIIEEIKEFTKRGDNWTV